MPKSKRSFKRRQIINTKRMSKSLFKCEEILASASKEVQDLLQTAMTKTDYLTITQMAHTKHGYIIISNPKTKQKFKRFHKVLFPHNGGTAIRLAKNKYGVKP